MTFCDLKRVITFQATYFILRKLRALKCFAFLQIKIIDVKNCQKRIEKPSKFFFFFLPSFYCSIFNTIWKVVKKVEEEGKKTSSNNSILVAMLRRFGHAFWQNVSWTKTLIIFGNVYKAVLNFTKSQFWPIYWKTYFQLISTNTYSEIVKKSRKYSKNLQTIPLHGFDFQALASSLMEFLQVFTDFVLRPSSNVAQRTKRDFASEEFISIEKLFFNFNGFFIDFKRFLFLIICSAFLALSLMFSASVLKNKFFATFFTWRLHAPQMNVRIMCQHFSPIWKVFPTLATLLEFLCVFLFLSHFSSDFRSLDSKPLDKVDFEMNC